MILPMLSSMYIYLYEYTYLELSCTCLSDIIILSFNLTCSVFTQTLMGLIFVN